MISMDCTRSQQTWLKTTRWLATVSPRHATNNAHVRCTATLLMSLSQSLLFILYPCDLFYIFTFGYCCGQEFHENVWIPGHKTRTYVTLKKYAVSANSGILHRPCGWTASDQQHHNSCILAQEILTAPSSFVWGGMEVAREAAQRCILAGFGVLRVAMQNWADVKREHPEQFQLFFQGESVQIN